MTLTDQQKHICEQVINAFESSTAAGKYGLISIMDDGPHNVKQVSYGRSQTTEYGNLEELLQMYVNENGIYSDELSPYLPKIGVVPLVNDATFKKLLYDAGIKDPIMRQVQDQFFDLRYFQPAMGWADDNGFSLPLSALVIYDSYIHSGSIMMWLRKRFPESSPKNGGDEKIWISQYVDARNSWLATNSSQLLRNTIYRTACLKSEIVRNNWDLDILPIRAHGVDIFG
ncbi:MAG: chitosanase [Prolixibacteraceae bacterium]